MEPIYDMEALYLYSDGWEYRVGRIEKVNDKSIRMERGRKITKEEFKNIHKLTDEEIKCFKGELIKKLSKSINEIRVSLDMIRSLRLALNMSEFATVDSSKIQEKLDLLNELLDEELPGVIEIDGKKFELKKNTEGLDEVK